MARGFESKDVEFQQAEAERVRRMGPQLTADERRAAESRRTKELSLARARADLDAARVPAHRTMLQQAVAVLEAEPGRDPGSMTRACPPVLQWCAAVVLLTAVACGGGDGPGGAPNAAPPSAAAIPAPPDAGPRPESPIGRPRIVVLGDSLTAGLGLPPDAAYPALLQQRLNEEGLPYQVVNAGVSGDTSAGGLSRLDWTLEGDVRVLVVALGGNDALRGLPVDELRRNLSTIIERARDRKIRVVLAGMEAPPNFGRSYTVSFHDVYADLVKKYDVAFVPFLLDRVAGIESLNQRDGIHPTAEGARIIADNVWRTLRPMLQ